MVLGSREHGNEPAGSIEHCEILEQVSDWRLLKEELVMGHFYWHLRMKINRFISPVSLCCVSEDLTVIRDSG
jgi:hypothetical protein